MHTPAGMGLESMMFGSWTQEARVGIACVGKVQSGRGPEAESQVPVSKVETGNAPHPGYGCSFCSDVSVLALLVLMVAHVYKCAKTQYALYLFFKKYLLMFNLINIECVISSRGRVQ